MSRQFFSTQSIVIRIALLGIPLLLVGCLERKERIRVRDDGSVQITAQFKGTQEELDGPCALPTESDDWEVRKVPVTEVPEEGGKPPKYILTADQSWPPGEPLPATFDPDSNIDLMFPTDVRRSDTEGGTWFEFCRRYEARPWAYIERIKKTTVEKAMKERGLKDDDIEQWSDYDRLVIASSLIEFEHQKQVVLLRRAALGKLPHVSIPQFLVAKTSADSQRRFDLSTFRLWAASVRNQQVLQETLDAAAELEGKTASKPFEVSAEEITQRVEKLNAGYLEDFNMGLRRGAGVSENIIANIAKDYERETRMYAITEALRTQSFRVELTMPGDIRGHNADEQSGQVLIWEFNGEDLCDRDIVLMAASSITKQP